MPPAVGPSSGTAASPTGVSLPLSQANLVRIGQAGDRVLFSEVQFAEKIAEAKTPEERASIERDRESATKPLWAELEKAIPAGSALTLDSFRATVDKTVAEVRHRHEREQFVSSLVEKDFSREAIESALGKDPRFTSPQDIQAGLRQAAALRVDSILNYEGRLTFVRSAEYLQAGKPFTLDFSLRAESIPGESAREGQHRRTKLSELDRRFERLSEEYAGVIDKKQVEALRDARRKVEVVESYLFEHRKDSWDSLAPALKAAGALSVIPQDVLQAKHFRDRIDQPLKTICQCRYQMGYLTLPATRYENAEAKDRLATVTHQHDEAMAQLNAALGDSPKPIDRGQLDQVFIKQYYAGLNQWNTQRDRQVAQAEAAAAERLANQSALDRLGTICSDAVSAVPRFVESSSALVLGNFAQAGGFVYGAATLQNPLTTAADTGGAFLNWQRGLANSVSPGLSVFGTDEQFASSAMWEVALRTNPLQHLGQAVIEPLFQTLDVGRVEVSRGMYNVGGAEMSYADYLRYEQQSPTLQWARRSFQVAEIAGSLALMDVGIPGASAGQLLRPFAVSAGFGAASGLSQELMSSDGFSVERFLDRSLESTAHSTAFMAGISAVSKGYLAWRLGSDVPKSLEELQRIQLTSPATFARVERAYRELQVVRDAVDFVDSQSDLSESLGQLGRVQTGQQLAGALLGVLVAGSDAFDVRLGLGTAHADGLRGKAQVKIELEGRTIEGNVSRNGSIVYVDTVDDVRALYRARTGSAETSHDVLAYYDPALQKVVATRLAADAPALQRAVNTSLLVHEAAHQAGQDEAGAYATQARYLATQGLEMHFEEGAYSITPTPTPATPTTESILDFVNSRHTGDVAVMPARDGGPATVAAPATPSAVQGSGISSLSAADMERDLQLFNTRPEALSDLRRFELYWGLVESGRLDEAKDAGALRTAAETLIATDVFLVDEMSPQEAARTAGRLRFLGTFEEQAESVRLQLTRAEGIMRSAQRFDADARQLSDPETLELYFADRSNTDTDLVRDRAVLAVAAREAAVRLAQQLDTDAAPQSIEATAVLHEQLAELSLLDEVSPRVRTRLEQAVELDNLTAKVLDGATLSDAQVGRLGALATEWGLATHSVIPVDNPQFQQVLTSAIKASSGRERAPYLAELYYTNNRTIPDEKLRAEFEQLIISAWPNGLSTSTHNELLLEYIGRQAGNPPPGSDGVHVPHNSMWFKFWRDRVEKSIPDTAYVMHFATPAQRLQFMRRETSRLEAENPEPPPSGGAAAPRPQPVNADANSPLHIAFPGMTDLSDALPGGSAAGTFDFRSCRFIQVSITDTSTGQTRSRMLLFAGSPYTTHPEAARAAARTLGEFDPDEERTDFNLASAGYLTLGFSTDAAGHRVVSGIEISEPGGELGRGTFHEQSLEAIKFLRDAGIGVNDSTPVTVRGYYATSAITTTVGQAAGALREP